MGVSSALACRATQADPVILALGDQTVRRSDFQRHLQALEKRGGAPLAPEVRTALLGPFLEERILVLEARSRGLLPAHSSSEEEQAAIRKLLQGSVLAGVTVEPAEIEAYYKEHAEECRAPESVTLRQILVPTESEALEVLRRVRRDPKSFGSLARSRSHSPEASSGGVLGSFARGQLPAELEAAAFALSPGGTSEVVKTSLGCHILRLDARKPARDRPLEECRDEIRALLARRKSDQTVSKFVQGLLARAKVNHEAAEAPPRDS